MGGGVVVVDHIEDYLQWLKENMTQENIAENLIEITTPFLDRHNDYTQIYISKIEKNRFRISDMGYIVNDLKMTGVDLTKGKRKEMLALVLQRLGIVFNGKTEELYVLADHRGIPEAQHRLMQGMLDVNDLFYLNSPNVRGLFLEEVDRFFKDNGIYNTRDVNITGRSGLSHTFNYVLQENRAHPERFVRVMNAPDRGIVERYIFSWHDVKAVRNKLKKNRRESELIVIMNDATPINDSLISSFGNYDIIPFVWSKKMENLPLLA